VKKSIYDAATRNTVEVPMDKTDDQQFIAGEMMKLQAPQVFDVPVEERWITVICPALMQDDVLVEMPYEVQDRGWQHKMITCYDWHPDITKIQSVVDAMVSPQDAINQREMSWLEFVLDLLNPKTAYPKGSIGPEQMPAWEQGLRGAMLEYNAGAAGQAPEPMYPNGEAARLLVQNKEENFDKMNRLSGVTPNLGGQAQSPNESGVLFSQRVQAALFNLATIVTHQGNTMRHLFGYVDKLLQENMTLQRTVRLLSEPVDGMNGVQSIGEGHNVQHWLMVNWPTLQGVMNDVKQGEYDFKVDMTQLGPTAKRMKFAESVEIMNQLPPELKPYHLFIKSWDSPDAGDWAKYVEGKMGMQQQVQAQQQQEAQTMQTMEMLKQKQNLEFNGAERAKQLLEPRQ
jgi:hypothetical protein